MAGKIVVFILSLVALPWLTTWAMFKLMDRLERDHQNRVAAEAIRMIRRGN